jgi:amino acid adenylation domain-containing protein
LEYLLQHLLSNSADKYPNHAAVIYQDKSISYKEIDELTDKLAVTLINTGIKKGDRVGIYINKSIPSIVSIFGILKAGAVYVPLDPKAPLERLAYIIRNCGIECLLTSTARVDSVTKIFSNGNPLNTIIITDELFKSEKDYNLNILTWEKVVGIKNYQLNELIMTENDLAYIIYTSGSTGVPKGVMISHLNSLTFVRWVQTIFQIKPKDRLSNHAPLHFDLSILDIFGAFQAGATLVLVPEMISTFPRKLADWIEENKISLWYSVPSILTMMLLHGDLSRHKFENLRLVLFAGEVFPTKYLRDLMKKIPLPEYYNLYGPTETNVITYYKVNSIPPEQESSIPIGKSCANMEVFALTNEGKIITEPGNEGELYSRGSCVAQGYWGDPEKTTKNFVRNPLQKNYFENAYRTGDIVTLDGEGNYLYRGRKDHMIKSRGYRIEIGEIETALYSNSDIKEAAVIPIPDDVIGYRIKSFIVSHNGDELNFSELRMYLGKKLPQYMIPDEIEFCSSLPKTSTGKIDKTALLKLSKK